MITFDETIAQADNSASVNWPPDITTADYLRLYTEVGEPWKWCDRRLMPEPQLEALLAQANRHIGILTSVDGTEAGFTEVCRHSNDECEIVYFGLLPEWTGRGLGSVAFRQVVAYAQSLTNVGGRIWLSTCEWDSPAALPFYQRMGFQIVREETSMQQVSD